MIVLQTIAANLGSMLTPIGNPQNLYYMGNTDVRWNIYTFDAALFSGVTAFTDDLCGNCGKRSGIEVRGAEVLLTEDEKLEQKKYLLPAYLLLFVLCLLTVAHMIPYPVTLGTVALAVLL